VSSEKLISYGRGMGTFSNYGERKRSWANGWLTEYWSARIVVSTVLDLAYESAYDRNMHLTISGPIRLQPLRVRQVEADAEGASPGDAVRT
jgi:hypothetical protein